MKAAIFSLALALTFTGCSRLSSRGLDREKLAGDVAAGSIVDLSRYTSFEWDRVFIFAPYTSAKVISDVVGSDVSFPGRNSEAYCLLVFRFQEKPVRAFEVERKIADFAELFQHSGYTQEDSVFVVDVRKAGGWRVLKKKDALQPSKAPMSGGSP